MTQALRIAIADDEPRMLQFLELALRESGHDVVVKAENGRVLVEKCNDMHPDLVITDIKMPDMDGLQAISEIRSITAIPVILVSAYDNPEYVDTALRNHVLAYLVKPIKKRDLDPAICLVMQRFREFEALQRQADDLRQALEDRKLVERAKGILMRRTGLSEQEAFRRLQDLASNKNIKMVEIARSIVTAEEAFK
jgi:response regulator NasT